MRFSHTADCHVGGHRDPRLRQLTETAFARFIDESIQANVDFIIIAGDLFNTAIPGIDTLKFVVTQLGKPKAKNIPVYAIPGSHDYSPSGKTMLDVLEEAGLLRNVCRGTVTDDGKLKLSFTTDQRTGVKLTGVIGKRGMLDRHIYEELDRSIEREPGKKVFLFHTSISELKPQHLQEMESYPVSFLPKGFDYYAGGHVHIVERYAQSGYGNVVYPGPLFPNSFSELERLRHGGYYIYDDTAAGAPSLTRREIALKEVISIKVNVEGMESHDADRALHAAADGVHAKGAIVLLRIEGTLRSGSPNDINVRDTVSGLEQRGAYIVLRNTARLTSQEFASMQVKADEPHRIEETLLAEHADQLAIPGGDGAALARELLKLLAREQHEGENANEYHDRMVKDALGILDQKP